jgi:hypothetical protein
MLTSVSQFTKGIILIEGVLADAGNNPVAASINDGLQAFIDQYEPEYMRYLLGYENAKAFIAYYTNRPTAEADKVEKWEYLIDFIESFTTSPVACYIFYWYVRAVQTRATHNGVMAINSDNPIVSPKRKMADAYNSMVADTFVMIKYDLYHVLGNYDCEVFRYINAMNV